MADRSGVSDEAREEVSFVESECSSLVGRKKRENRTKDEGISLFIQKQVIHLLFARNELELVALTPLAGNLSPPSTQIKQTQSTQISPRFEAVSGKC